MVEHIKTTEELSKKLKPLYVIHDYTKSRERYQEFIDSIYDIVRGCFEYHKLRTYPVHFKFYEKDNDVHTLELRYFLVNIMYWFPFVDVHDRQGLMTDETMITKPEDVADIDSKINDIIAILIDSNVKNTKINSGVSLSLHNMRSISGEFSLIMGLKYDMVDIAHMYLNNPVVHDMMNVKFPEGAQPKEIENILNESEIKLIKALREEPRNMIGVLLNAKEGIKHKQLVEMFISKGLIPDLDGNTIPMAIENSTIRGGLSKPSDIFIDASGTRKSLILNKHTMGKATHFGKSMTELTRTIRLSTKVSDCGTRHHIKYYVTSDKFLKKIDKRFYKLDPNDEEYKVINYKKDKDLVGKFVYVRSIVTCALKDEFCAKCLGLTANLNFDIADGIGAFLSEELMKTIEQSVLSAKHLLTTFSTGIDFNIEFHRFFDININQIHPSVDDNNFIDDFENYELYVPKNSITKVDYLDDDSEVNTIIKGGIFYVVDKSTGEMIKMQEVNANDLNLTNECIELLKQYKYKIPFTELDDDIPLFSMVIENNELTKPLYRLMGLISSEKDNGNVLGTRSIDNVCQKLLETIIESNIPASALSSEIVVNRLLRDKDDIYKRIDFGGLRIKPYQIISLNKALTNNPSPLAGLSFQNIPRQMKATETYDGTRTQSSWLDPFWTERYDTRAVKKKIISGSRIKNKK